MTISGPDARPARPSLPLPHNRSFIIFATTQALSLFGDKLDYMALLAMVAWFTERHGWNGARVLSTVPVIMALPAVLFGPLAGVLADRWDRRAVMVGADIGRTLLVAAVPFVALATGSLGLIYAVAFMVFLLGVLFQAARMATIPNIVGVDRVLGANSLMNVAGRVATVLGTLCGGMIVDWSGWSRLGINPPWAAGYYIDALTYAVSVIALLAVYRSIAPQERVVCIPSPAPPPAFRDSIGSAIARRAGQVITDLRTALGLARRTPTVLFVYCSAALLVFIGAAWLVLYVPIIQSRTAAGLGLGTRGVGFIAGFGAVGLLLSTATYGVVRRVPKHRVMLASFVLIGLAAVGLAFARRFEHAAALMFFAGLGISPLYIGMDTLLHQTVPDAARGRIFSTREWLMHLLFAFFALCIGQATRLLPARGLLLAVGLATVAAGMLGFFTTRHLSID